MGSRKQAIVQQKDESSGPSCSGYTELQLVHRPKGRHKFCVQGKCCCSFAAAAAEATSAVIKIKTGKAVSLSPQSIGAPQSLEDAFEFIRKYGIRTVERRSKKYKIYRFERVPPGEHSLLKAVSQQPVAALIAGKDQFKSYKGGIFMGEPYEDKELNIAVLVVGFNLEPEDGIPPYLLIKGCFGTDWGEKGFARLLLGGKEGGVNGIAKNAMYPVLREDCNAP